MIDKDTRDRLDRADDALRAKGWIVETHYTASGDRVSFNKPPYDEERQRVLDHIMNRGASNVDFDTLRKTCAKFQAKAGKVKRGKG